MMLDRLGQLTVLPHEPVGWCVLAGSTLLAGGAAVDWWWTGRRAKKRRESEVGRS